MKAMVYHGVGHIRLDDVPEPKIEDPNDAIVRITGSAICGTDLHMVRGTMPGMEEGTILGREAVGIVEDLGSNVRNFTIGDHVVISSTIACGYCVCTAGRGTSRSATTPTRTGRTRERACSAARNRPARSTACRRNSRACSLPTSG